MWPFKPKHKCDFKKVPGSMRETGFACLNWDAIPGVEYEFLERCQCGLERWQDGWCLPTDVERSKRGEASYRGDGYPLLEDGSPMPVKKYI